MACETKENTTELRTVKKDDDESVVNEEEKDLLMSKITPEALGTGESSNCKSDTGVKTIMHTDQQASTSTSVNENGDKDIEPDLLTAPELSTMSKNQLKKMRKRERWLAIKHEKRKQEKQKRKQRIAERREAGEVLGPTRKTLKTNTMKNSSCKIRVVLDLSLDGYMVDKDVTSLIRQLQHSYSTNRRAANPMQLYFCGLCGKTKERLDSTGDYQSWDVFRESRSYEEMFTRASLVYLTSDSPNILTTLSEDQVYIIGAFVDHNQHKGLCHSIAEEKGISHAQLPISEFLHMSTRKVLAVNQVFSILLRYSESQDWQKAFLSEIPQRKQFTVQGNEDDCSGLTTEDKDEGKHTEENCTKCDNGDSQ